MFGFLLNIVYAILCASRTQNTSVRPATQFQVRLMILPLPLRSLERFQSRVILMRSAKRGLFCLNSPIFSEK